MIMADKHDRQTEDWMLRKVSHCQVRGYRLGGIVQWGGGKMVPEGTRGRGEI